MKHTVHPLTDVIGHFSRQSRRMALCAGLGLLLILGSLGFGSYWLYKQNTKLKEDERELKAALNKLSIEQGKLTDALEALSIERDNLELALKEAGAANRTLEEAIIGLKAEKDAPALAKSIETLESSAAKLREIADHWGWYAVFASYRTEKDAQGAASRAGKLEGLGGDIIGVYLAENGYYALTLGGELSDRNEAQEKVQKAKPVFDGAYLRHGKNWKEVAHVGSNDAARAGPARRQ